MQAFDGDRYQGWAEYTVYGGMPLALSMRTDEQKARYLERLFEETYLRDVVDRYGIRRRGELDDLVNVLASGIGTLTNPRKLENTFRSVLHSKISSNTISSYIGYLEDVFVIEEARRYDVKGRGYIGSPLKYYFEDVGLRNARLGFRQVEESRIMENVVTTSSGRAGTRWMSAWSRNAFARRAGTFVSSLKWTSLPMVKPLRDERGMVATSVFGFLLDENSLVGI